MAGAPGRDTTNDSDEIFSVGGDPAVRDLELMSDGYRAGICCVHYESNQS